MANWQRAAWVGLAWIASLGTAAAELPSKPGDWPQWRGPHRDGVSTETGLLKAWPEQGPPRVWSVDSVGVGYSSVAIKDGRIFTQGDLNGVEHILALDAKDGRVLWAVQPAPAAAALAARVAADLKAMDKDGDGTVSEKEALARMGWDWTKYDRPTDAPLEQTAERRHAALFKDLDANTDGKLSYEEAGALFRNAFSTIDLEDPQADADAVAGRRTAELLKALDKDGDARLSKTEIKGTVLEQNFGRFEIRDPNSGKGDDHLTSEEIAAGFAKYEKGRDGSITAAELKQHYLRSRLAGDGVFTAEEIRGTAGGYRNGQGDGPRGTPTVDGDKVYVEGGFGDLTCLEAATGKTLWHVHLSKDFGGGVPGWGYSESPLIEGNLVIVTPGGSKGTVAALDKATGKTVWQSPGFTERAHYSSPVVAEIGGIRQIVQFSGQSVFGVALEDGKPLWRYAAPANGTANCCAPIVEGDLVYASSGYGTGGGLAKIVTAGTTQSAEEQYFDKKLACHHGGVVKVGEHLYSAGGGALICMHMKTGEIAWQARSVGKGSLTAADGMLYILSEGHVVGLVEANPKEYVEHGRFKIESHGRPSWAHPVVAGGRLYLRDQQMLSAYDIRAK